MANGLVVVREGPLVEEDEDEDDYQEQGRERERDEDEDGSRDGPTPVQRPKMMHTRSDTNVLRRLANKETRLSPPRVAVAVQQQQQGDGQGPQGRSPQIPAPNTYTHISAYPIPRPSSTSTVSSSSPSPCPYLCPSMDQTTDSIRHPPSHSLPQRCVFGRE